MRVSSLVLSVTLVCLVGMLVSIGACAGGERPADAPMAGSAPVASSPASAEVVPKGTTSTSATEKQHDFVMPATLPTECPCKAKTN